LIPNIEKFLAVTIFKTHISNFDDIGKCWICAVLWWPFWKWRPLEIFHCRESIRDFIIYPHMKCRCRTNSTLSDFNDISYVGRLWCPKFIPDIEKFLAVVIFKMATTIPHKFNIECWICAVLWWAVWKWWPLEIFHCRESIRDFIIYPHMKCRWNRTMLNLCGMIMMSRHWKISTGRHFQNGRHNTAKIQHCPISSKLYMWVDNDVPN
jgi:hypothetical protein